MKNTKKIVFSLLIILSLVFSTSEFLPAPQNTATVEAATKARLNKTKATLIKGQTLNLKMSGAKSSVKWSSSKSGIATVNAKGKVTARKKGTAVITAKVGKQKYTCKITVQTPSISKKSVTLTAGSNTTLKIKGTNQKIKWSSSKKSVATVNSSGKITAKKAGTATITATVLHKTYKCKVTVKKACTSSDNSGSENTSDSDSGSTDSDSSEDNADSTTTSYVYLPATGSKYHSIPNCGRMNPSKARKVTEQEAINKGYSKCTNCF